MDDERKRQRTCANCWCLNRDCLVEYEDRFHPRDCDSWTSLYDETGRLRPGPEWEGIDSD